MRGPREQSILAGSRRARMKMSARDGGRRVAIELSPKSMVDCGMGRANLEEDLGSAIAPVERETLNDRVYRELKNSIMAGSFKPGAELTLRSVADALGTSLMPVRDAMRRLVSERALEVRPSRKIALPVLTVDQFLELRRIRLQLEGDAVALAAEKIAPRQLGTCRSLLKRLEALDEARRGQFWALNHKLHFAIYEAARSPLLLSIIESLWLQIGPLLTRISTARAVKDSADPHALLVQALARHDPIAARRALEMDLTQSTERVMEELVRQKAIRH
jgi:DNA-binding GntR family transcriptional regulator